jgi:hypothetical protein
MAPIEHDGVQRKRLRSLVRHPSVTYDSGIDTNRQCIAEPFELRGVPAIPKTM